MRSSTPNEWQPRAVCDRCRRPVTVCYCAHVRPVETKTRVLILQHPRERDVAIGTARMASLCLPNAELAIGIAWDDSPVLARALSDPERPAVLLYPDAGAIDVAAHPPPGPVTLIVVDGTWAQAKTVVRRNPHLRALPKYTFVPPTPSEYRIRREPKADYVSTIEALVLVLGALERDPERLHPLLTPFRAMVDAQIEHAARLQGARTRHARSKRRKALGVPRIFRERFADLVCVVGEANAWPYLSRERVAYDDELVHWVAHRVATGETFDFTIAPRNPLAPRTADYVGLSAECLARGGRLEDLAVAWRAFCREDDAVCFWGHYGAALFAESGGFLPATRVDLRHVARGFAGHDGASEARPRRQHQKVGTLEGFLASLGLPARPPLVPGRAGMRAEGLARFVRHLGEIARSSPA